MKILLLGGGGREHALAWKLSQSPECDQLWIAPGNGGTSHCGENVDVAVDDFATIGDFVLTNGVNTVVVGPEDPLVNGIRDYFAGHESLQDVHLIGPSKEAAQLEGSKAYAKAFMEAFNIPTAASRTFDASTVEEGVKWLSQQTPPYVLKADGLASGKGVLVLDDLATAQQELRNMIQEKKFGEASQRVIVEEHMSGREFSVFALTDGLSWKILPVAKDYKRIGEKGTGANTGGMGAVSPVPFVAKSLLDKVKSNILQPTIDGLQQRGLHYQGFLYLGLMEVDEEPYVVEYNIRLGDPEAQVVLLRLKSDLLPLLTSMKEGRLAEQTISYEPNAAASVVLASEGYPGKYEKGKVISGLDDVQDSYIFHAGTEKDDDGQLVTSGGRVLSVNSLSTDILSAAKQSIANADKIQYEGEYFRRDIGH
ncbi:MAG: phosphoribosylamine--glycine ligase [Bacteroidetes bacterium SW_11_45_7]|nr:MAG: phosphoribosylamine--glycine ligase [Bacteroidetes bacterium SW_11_45_7]